MVRAGESSGGSLDVLGANPLRADGSGIDGVSGRITLFGVLPDS